MADRVDEHGAAFAGSQLQIQLYVNRRAEQLSEALASAFPELRGTSVDWRSPLAADGCREYWDQGFLDRVDLGHHAADLGAFWPAGGPHWDALAVVHTPGSGRPGVILAEGKSYPGELYGGGCGAVAGSASRTLIEKSLAWTQASLGVTSRTAEDWCGPLYQKSTRPSLLAALSRSARLARPRALHGRPARSHDGTGLAGRVESCVRGLGLDGVRVEHVGHVFLPAGTRTDLLS